MQAEKSPAFKVSGARPGTPSERPSTAGSVASELRPRSIWSENALRHSASPDTAASYLGTKPVRLFKHRRLQHHGDASLSSTTKLSDTEVTYPKSLHDVDRWLSDVVATAQQPLSDHSSAICLLFMDEDKCKREYPNFSLDRIYSHLKIDDWRPSHFQTTFLRFAVPLDVDIEKDAPGKLSKHHNWDWRFGISHPFEWDMLWGYFPASRTSVGIVRTWIEGYTADFMDLESMAKSFRGPTLGHPMLLGLFALDILTRDSMAVVRHKGEQLWQAQKVTGYNHFPHQNNKRLIMTDEDYELAKDIGAQTAVVMGAAINLTSWIHAATALAGFADFVRTQSERFMAGPYGGARDAGCERLAVYVAQHAQKQVGDLDAAHYDTSAWLDTARFLLQGVLNLGAQRDAAVNIQLARDSQMIAEDSKRDSTSMMSLSIVAMMFLPGTYTASLFAMPLFVDSVTTAGAYKMWLYWFLTGITTLVVFICWYGYTTYKFRHMGQQYKPPAV